MPPPISSANSDAATYSFVEFQFTQGSRLIGREPDLNIAMCTSLTHAVCVHSRDDLLQFVEMALRAFAGQLPRLLAVIGQHSQH